MLRIDNVKTEPGASRETLRACAAAALRVAPDAVEELRVLRRSVDARAYTRGGACHVRLVWSLAVTVRGEADALRRCKGNRNVSRYAPASYAPPAPLASVPLERPVVVGAGPAGLFCALLLAKCGARPILLERGKSVEERARDVERFWQTGALDTESNVQFGEGGAGGA